MPSFASPVEPQRWPLRGSLAIACAIACAACSAPDGEGAPASVAPVTETPDAGDAPPCDPEQPSAACVRRLFEPLRGGDLPFDTEKVAAATGIMEFWVAREWAMTAHHVLAGTTSFPYGCFFESYRYATDLVPFDGPGCGTMLVAGGHPHALRCRDQGVPMRACAQQVAPREAFDLVVRRVPPRDAALDLAPPPAVGDPVFVVGHPNFRWLTSEEREALAPLYPLVSRGKVVRVDGRAVVVDAPCYEGNSGGALLDARGDAIGVMYSRIRAPAPGVSLPPEIAGGRCIAVLPDEPTRDILRRARADAR